MRLSRLAETMLDELAQQQGLPALQPNEDGIIPVELGDVTLAIAFSEQRDTAYFMTVLSDRPDQLPKWQTKALAFGATFKQRPTRLAVEPQTGQLVLVSHLALAGARADQFNAALEQFLGDVRATRASLDMHATSGSSAKAPLSFENEFIFRV